MLGLYRRLRTVRREIRVVRRPSVLKLWPIIATSVMSENDGVTVRQTAVQLWPHVVCVFRGERHSNPFGV